MNEETSGERHVERDSQLSAMFDGELSAAECELLARRLGRDDGLRSQWSRYSMIGAALRAERGVALHERVAFKVQAALNQEVTYGEDSVVAGYNPTAAVVPGEVLRRAASRRWAQLAKPMFGAGIAASVAAASIFMLRGQGDAEQPRLLAAAPSTQSIVVAPDTGVAPPVSVADARAPSNGEPERYSTPPLSAQPGIAPPARLANYVVAHSEYSGPLSRRMALLSLVGTESAGEAELANSPDGAEPAAGATQKSDNGSDNGQ